MKCRIWQLLNLFLVVFAFYEAFTFELSAQNQVDQSLTNDWKLTNSKTGELFPCRIPSEVHTTLFENQVIEDPFFGKNETDLQWIGDQQWDYSCTFLPDESLLQCGQIELQFGGLDTYCSIYLNDSLLLQTNNAFRSWRIPVKSLIKNEINSLIIKFIPIDSLQQNAANNFPFLFPTTYCFSRKAAYQSGWDWCPTYKTMGITKPIKLVGWSNAIFRNVSVLQVKVDSSKAGLRFIGEIESTVNQTITIVIDNPYSEMILQQFKVVLGSNQFEIPYTIVKPKLWWPNGLGNQYLYRFEISMIANDQIVDKQTIKTGIRNLELINEPDSIGQSFYFKVNGVPVFMKGSNYIPMDNFITKITPARTRKLLIDAAKVNMNMIRVWGGGIYPDDDFYDDCDSLGLLVWQDFMFAGSMYPFDDQFINNVEKETSEQIQRLRSHPSLALWCGNNEVSEAFHNWGWQKSLQWSAKDSIKIWHGYQLLFEKILPDLVKINDSGRPYWPSSPSIGWGRKESMTQGDSHYWGVWWGEEPFTNYEEKVGRFMSEFGFQSMPEMTSIRKFANADPLQLEDSLIQAHQKHNRGKYLIDKYMEQQFPVPEKLDDYVYVSQLVQAAGMTKAIEAHRRAMPRCMGSLYWQLNDSWPAISWSSIDYYGNWKVLHYQLKKAFAPVLISFEKKEGFVNIFIVNDLRNEVHGKLELKLSTFSGEILDSVTQEIVVRPASSEVFISWPEYKKFDVTKCYIQVQLLVNEQVTAENIFYFVDEKYLSLSNEQPKIEVAQVRDFMMLTLSSTALVKDLRLQSNDPDGFFESNFVDLTPDSKRTIVFKPSGNVELKNLIFTYNSLNGMMHSD